METFWQDLSFGARRQRLRNLLVVSEVALALTLLVGGGMALKSFWKLLRVDAGFRAERVLTMDLVLAEERYREITSAAISSGN